MRVSRRLVATNSLWLISDKVVRLAFGLAVWLWLARQAGADAFGQWNYAIALASLFGAVASLGLDGIVQRELLAGRHDRGVVLGSAIALRVSVGLVAAAACVGTIMVLRPGETVVQALVAFNALVFVLQSTQVIDWYFQSQMKNGISVMAMNAAFLAATAVRLILLWMGFPILWIGATLVLEAAIAAVLLIVAIRAYAGNRIDWRCTAGVCRHLLAEGWPMLLSGLAVTLYMRVDQLMLASMLGDSAVGQFSAALRIAEVWYFVPMSIMAAAFPAMMARRAEGDEAYHAYLQQLYDAMAWLGIGVAAIVTIVAPSLVSLLYGDAYAEAADILRIQIWAGVTVAMSFVHSRWLLAEGLQRLSLLYALSGCTLNLCLNFLLIPQLGARGAAWATLTTQVALLPMQLLFPKARRNFILMTKVPFAPFRLIRR